MIPKKIEDIVQQFAEECIQGVEKRWNSIPVEISKSEAYEVVGALMARQATLAVELALSPSTWNVHIAPLILRSMTDAHITLAWILGDFELRAKEYISYGIGQEKLLLEHLESEGEESDEKTRQLIEMKRQWINSQRSDWFVEINVGSWSGSSTRKMAKECGCDSLYKFAYTSFSAATHSMWQHVSIHNLAPCMNPLHKFHKTPTIQPAPFDVDFVYVASKYISRTFEAIDKYFDLDADTELPVISLGNKLEEHFSEIGNADP